MRCEFVNFMGDRGKTLTRLPPDYDPGDATLSRSAGEGGPSPKGLVGEGAPPPRKLQSSGPFGGSARRLAVLFALCEHEGVEIVIARDAGKVLARMQSAKARDIREAIDRWPPIQPRQTTICAHSEACRTGFAFGSATGASRTRSITRPAS